MLPEYLLEDIINRLENAKNIALASCVCTSFKEAGKIVKSLRIVCLNEYHVGARAERPPSNFNQRVDSSASTSQIVNNSASTSSHILHNAARNDDDDGYSSSDERRPLIFRDLVVKVLKGKRCLVQLRIEIEPRLQSKSVPEGERRKTDHWLSDPLHLKQWIPSVKDTLQHLCIVDYGQQAIMRRTQILKLLSQNCEWLFLQIRSGDI